MWYKIMNVLSVYNVISLDEEEGHHCQSHICEEINGGVQYRSIGISVTIVNNVEVDSIGTSSWM